MLRYVVEVHTFDINDRDQTKVCNRYRIPAHSYQEAANIKRMFSKNNGPLGDFPKYEIELLVQVPVHRGHIYVPERMFQPFVDQINLAYGEYNNRYGGPKPALAVNGDTIHGEED